MVAAGTSRPDGWWKSAVVYQVYPRSFADSNGDGIGDLPGVTEHVDYLADLGVDVIWLSPFFRSPQVDNGYDISDYYDVDPTFGTLDDVDALIDAAHRHGMKIVIDLVVNHTSDQHPWFVESRDPDSPKRSWYFWRPARPGVEPGTPGAEPNDLAAAFAPSAWTFDPRSGEYYLHIFSPQQPDLNWENPEVRESVYAMMRWWVDRGVDGFRMDVINLISKPDELTGRAPLLADSTTSARSWIMGPRLDEFLAEMNREVGLDATNLLTVGEMPGSTVDTAVRATDPSRHELNMVFTFEHVDLDIVPGGTKWDVAPLSLPALKQNLARWQVALAEIGWNSLYLNNHDQPRAVSRFGDDSPEHRVNSAKTLATMLHMHKGTPYIYQGEEVGMTNGPFSGIEHYVDIDSINYYNKATGAGADPAVALRSLGFKSRDNARTPMHWDSTANAGFTAGTPWFPVNPNYMTINAAAAANDEDSVYHHYKKLIRLRHTSQVVREGRFELLVPDHTQIWAFTRTLDDEQLLVLANCSSTTAVLPGDVLQIPKTASIILGTHPDPRAESLRPWESRIYRIRL